MLPGVEYFTIESAKEYIGRDPSSRSAEVDWPSEALQDATHVIFFAPVLLVIWANQERGADGMLIKPNRFFVRVIDSENNAVRFAPIESGVLKALSPQHSATLYAALREYAEGKGFYGRKEA